ncbi:n-acetyltransferase domain-containing protein [Caerostris darwini]|uniref:N-acetyltransferase domain-containing protein n=1 Tax=Caerostris darwini TaxID=1538125 RepID=A0AAV4M6W1_9ARAC|nr:n-acetyltransferase domain-containing protein [Caerostris darwini]
MFSKIYSRVLKFFTTETTKFRESKNGTQWNSCRNYSLQARAEPKVSFEIRTIREADIPQVMELRKQLKVHDVASSLRTWMKIDPEGIKVALNENDEIIGSCSFVKNHPDLYFGGLYCVQPKYRSLNIGYQIYKASLAHTMGKNKCGNAVLSMAEKYQRSGDFPIVEDEYMTLKNFIPHHINSESLVCIDSVDGIEIEPYQDCFLPSMLQYDASVVGYTRDHVLELNCKEADSKTFVAFKNGTCIGFGSIKKSCLGAARVGPLYADNEIIAEVLLTRLIESFPGMKGLAMMTVGSNVPANNFLKKLGNANTEACLRIYGKEKVKANMSKIYAFLDINFSPF